MENTNQKSKQWLTTKLAISMNQIDEYIEACQLNKEKNDYSPEEVDLLNKYHLIIEQADSEVLLSSYQESLHKGISVKSTLDELIELIELEDNTSPSSLYISEQSIPKINETVTLFELLNIAQDLTSKPMTLSKAIEFLKACNLPEQPQYEPGDANRFLDAVERVINRGESIREVAVRNGVTNNNPFDWISGASTNQVNQINSGLGARVEILDSKIKESYEQMYLKKLEESFFNGDFQRTYDQAYNQSRREREQREKSPFDQFIEQLDEGMASLGLNGGSAYTIEATPTYEALPSSDNESCSDSQSESQSD